MKRDFKITIDQLEKTIDEIFTEYGKECVEVANKKIAEAAKRGQQVLRDISPVDEGSPSAGEYARSWSVTDLEPKRGKNLLSGFTIKGKTIYSKAPHYRLTHLLENGHKLWQGGNSPAIPHISKAEDAVDNYLQTAIPSAIQGVE